MSCAKCLRINLKADPPEPKIKQQTHIKHTSVYLPEAAYEALRQVAFDERRKIHDLLMEGVELALKKRGYPPLAEMKVKHPGKSR
jgi:hypothetical protein